ncbi:MAG: phosphogluconate dehydratase [Chromatiales bacterium]|jgi:phosphogluconate dehydratase|nr:MAG: phosphogluconate dehydratase [Chromatiales bacterium]
MAMHRTVSSITESIRIRSELTRSDYLGRVDQARAAGNSRGRISCANLAHAFAAETTADKLALREGGRPNIGIVSAYNDMLSAHQPLARFPELIKSAAREAGATAQFAGGVPAMCDGVTQGQSGMELSLFSRDVIAQSTAIALSHGVFDAVLCLGVCDKIVPGLLIGALHFGHLPAIFVPAGPMTSGLSNDEKSRIRQLFAEGKLDRAALLDAESRAYHGPGTCTFYGTANSNQLLMEVMGLHLPGAAFVTPNTPLRDALTTAVARRAAAITHFGDQYTPISQVVNERAIVNAIVGLLATGGSTNHTIHLVAIARAAGIIINWDDFDALSGVVPLLARIYPNGSADVNHFHAAGGAGFVIRELLSAGLLHDDVMTVAGPSLSRYTEEPALDNNQVVWRPAPTSSGDEGVLRTAAAPFSTDGGMRLLRGNLGRSIMKVSAVKPEHRVVEAPAVIFDDQNELLASFKRGELNRDFVAVIRFQGPRANGMPELHKLTPTLASLQAAGFHVALLTDGRMSGASGKVPAAIHVSPECLAGGSLGKVRNGDVIRVDGNTGSLEARVAPDEWARREPAIANLAANQYGTGRELFQSARATALTAEEGASTFGSTVEQRPATRPELALTGTLP